LSKRFCCEIQLRRGECGEERSGLVLAAKDLQDVFGKQRIKTQRFGCIVDTLIERDDVIRARLVGQVEDPGVSGIAQARPVKTTGWYMMPIAPMSRAVSKARTGLPLRSSTSE
jgi:hypothetical protein